MAALGTFDTFFKASKRETVRSVLLSPASGGFTHWFNKRLKDGATPRQCAEEAFASLQNCTIVEKRKIVPRRRARSPERSYA